jgi:hypothetical protein
MLGCGCPAGGRPQKVVAVSKSRSGSFPERVIEEVLVSSLARG